MIYLTHPKNTNFHSNKQHYSCYSCEKLAIVVFMNSLLYSKEQRKANQNCMGNMADTSFC